MLAYEPGMQPHSEFIYLQRVETCVCLCTRAACLSLHPGALGPEYPPHCSEASPLTFLPSCPLVFAPTHSLAKYLHWHFLEHVLGACCPPQLCCYLLKQPSSPLPYCLCPKTQTLKDWQPFSDPHCVMGFVAIMGPISQS